MRSSRDNVTSVVNMATNQIHQSVQRVKGLEIPSVVLMTTGT